MKKSDHTEIYTLTRLAIFASQHGLSELSYGHAAKASHLSRGAIQRIFPTKFELQRQTLLHAHALLLAHVFAGAPEMLLSRWATWVEGKAGLAGCVLLDALQSKALTVELRALASDLMMKFLAQFNGHSQTELLANALLLQAALDEDQRSSARLRMLARL